MKINKKASAGMQLVLLIASVFAFSYMIGQMNFVSGAGETELAKATVDYIPKVGEFFKVNVGGSQSIVQWTGTSNGVASGITSTGQAVTWPAYSNQVAYGMRVTDVTAIKSAGFGQAGVSSTPNTVSGIATSQSAAATGQLVSSAGLDVTAVNAAGQPVSAFIPKGTVLTPTANGGASFIGSDGATYTLSKTQLVTAQEAGQIGAPVSENTVSGFFGFKAGTFMDAFAGGLMWAAIAYGVGMLVGSLLGFDEQNTQALSTALAAGAFTYHFLSTWSTTASMGAWAGLAGIGIAAIVFVVMYKDVETKIVRFDCMTWQPPSGGNNCEACNSDTLPCSEYRCRSLGQNCEIVNPGTAEEKCVNVNPRDVNPPIITPNNIDLTAGHQYTNVKNSPPGPGFTITRTGAADGCLKAFTPLKFGIKTDEPSQCRIDFNSTTSFDDMVAYMGGSNLYSYNHTETFSLPGAKAFENSSFKLENGKNLVFYLRCRDKNGNTNEAEYAVKFCMDPTPDTTAPKIKATSILNGGCVAEDTTSSLVEFYTDEPAECKWSHTDQSYDLMTNNMACNTNVYQLNAERLFTCVGNMTGIARDGTDFYVRCKDQPGMNENNRNKNMESYKFNLRGSTALKMKNLMPNSTIFGGVSPAPVELYVETLFGCDNGKAVCFYSTTENKGDFIRFFDTEKDDGVHTQRQDLAGGDYKYYIRCVDSGGNVANATMNFRVDIDTTAPVVARVYEESNMLKIVTIRDSECSYSFNDCDFTFEEGTSMPYANSTVHVAEWNKDKTYYIKCRDEFLNEPAECSAIVKPSQKLF